MTMIDFISAESREERAKLLSVALLAGSTNAIALMLVNSVAQAPDTATATSFALFGSMAATSVWATRYLTHRVNDIIELALFRVKIRLVEKIETTELERIERIGTTVILDRITENVTVISSSAPAIGAIFPSLCIFAFGVLYLLWLSPWAFAILCPLQLLAAHLYRTMNEEAQRLIDEQTIIRVRFLDTLMDLLRGAKEIRFNRQRRRDILDDFRHHSATLGDTSARTNQIFDDNALFVTTNMYVVIAALAFVLPQHIPMDGQYLSKLVATILFLWGSVQMVLSVYPAYVQANEALDNVTALEGKLDGACKGSRSADTQRNPWSGVPGRIEAINVEYAYPSENGDSAFRIGPMNLAIEPGELIFVVGGNGSGKSTFMKVLTGLYPPTKGTLHAGNIVVDSSNVEHYREMISVIFADFHLFSKAYGLLQVDPDAVHALLKEMQIEHKTSFADGAFTTRNLSTGQKKRLAMVLAYLDDRPVFVLDEWAADQDPEFRKHFYEEMLPALKRRGKTIVAVSHDDRYFHLADRVISMEYGQIRTIRTQSNRGTTPPAAAEQASEIAHITENAPELS